MPVAVLQLNDSALLIQAADGMLHSEPGFAYLTEQGIETGEAARALAWREPQHSYNQYWSQLNETPLPARERWARHHADIAFAQLRHLWRSAGEPEELMLLAPGSFTDTQLSLLLGMTGALPAAALTVMDSALAACLETDRETTFVELQLHQCVLTTCRCSGGRVSVSDQEVFTGLGQVQIQNSVARHISNLLIESHRHDPLHASETEQAIYDQLPGWLNRLGWEPEVSTALPTDKGELPFILRRDVVGRLIGERLASVRDYLARHPGCRLVLSHESGMLAGLTKEFSAAEVAAPNVGIANCLAGHEQILDQVDGLYRVCELDVGEDRGDKERTGSRLATHILHGDEALPLAAPISISLAGDGARLVNRIDEQAAATVVLRNGVLETVHTAPGVDLALPPACRPGEAIVLAGHEFRLIEVHRG